MLFLLFQIGGERYALDARKVVEVAPLVALKRLPQAPNGVAGVFNYHGQPVPAVDLCELFTGQPANEQLSTRILILSYHDHSGTVRLLGLIAEQATEMLRKDPADFLDTGVRIPGAPYLGPVLLDAKGPIQWLNAQSLLSSDMCELLFSEAAIGPEPE